MVNQKLPEKILEVLESDEKNAQTVSEIIKKGLIDASYPTVQKHLLQLIINKKVYECERAGKRLFCKQVEDKENINTRTISDTKNNIKN